jgi:hypothetical protein
MEMRRQNKRQKISNNAEQRQREFREKLATFTLIKRIDYTFEDVEDEEELKQIFMLFQLKNLEYLELLRLLQAWSKQTLFTELVRDSFNRFCLKMKTADFPSLDIRITDPAQAFDLKIVKYGLFSDEEFNKLFQLYSHFSGAVEAISSSCNPPASSYSHVSIDVTRLSSSVVQSYSSNSDDSTVIASLSEVCYISEYSYFG